MNRSALATLNITFSLILFAAALGLLLFGANKTVAIALFPIAFANLTIGLVTRQKAND